MHPPLSEGTPEPSVGHWATKIAGHEEHMANPLRSLTVYLLASEIRDPLDALCDPPPDFDVLHVIPGSEWLLCIRNNDGKKPDWTEFFRGVEGFNLQKVGVSSSVSALLLVPASDKLWALTFGHGRSLLREGIIEDRFGLKTALNAIDAEKIRAIDKETFDSLASQSRQQAIADTEFENFGIDVDRDLLYAVAGVPRDTKTLGRRLFGKDALCCSARVAIENLPEYLDLLSEYHESEAYKQNKRFAWVDNIYEVRDKPQKRKLDVRLVEKLNRRDLTNAWLALPEIVDWRRAKGFSYAIPTPSPKYIVDDLHLRYFLGSFQSREITLDTLALKRSKVVCFDHNGQEIDRWTAYRCLYAEIETEDDNFFLLTNGHWYKLNRDVVVEVKQWYAELEIDSKMLPAMIAGEWEDSYNKRLAELPQYRLFHSSTIQLPASRGPIEFCDLLGGNGRDLIHVKRFAKSSQLSHLFQQGTNSARLFRISPAFRRALSLSIEDDQELAKRLDKEPERREYRVIFAISSSSPSRLELPLFSKLSLRQALIELDGFGFRTAVVKILVPKEERELKRQRPSKSKVVPKTF
jgi:uncharacterized protein (TIGR04141 family)